MIGFAAFAFPLVTVKPERILVVTLRFLGDALLTTPLISSLKRAYPETTVDVLTFKTNAAILEGNTDIGHVLMLEDNPSTLVFLKLLVRLFKRYDIAISTQAGDRPVLSAVLAGRTSLGFVTEEAGKTWWKRFLLSRWLIFSKNYGHAVLENLRFCRLLGIEPSYKLTPPQCDADLPQFPSKPYAVLHIKPQWRYKEWHRDGWHALIKFLNRRQLDIVLTGSGQTDELRYLDDLLKGLDVDVTNLAGRLSLAEISELIGKAALFVGPDTGITHLAAATGTLTFSLFGPTDPVKWAPWPTGYADDHPPFRSVGTQHVGNVYLIQGEHERNCVPCQLEGCENHRNSHSACLEDLPASKLLQIIADAIDTPLTNRGNE